MTSTTNRRSAHLGLASRSLLAIGIAGSALAVGTVHTVTLCIVTAVLAGAAVLGWWGAEPMRARTSATLLLVTGVGLTAFTALQCVPMPIRWLAVLAPHNADVWSRTLSPLRESGPSWAPISLDPIATRVEVLKGVAYLLAFVTALSVARRKEGVTFLGVVIIATGIALALAAVLHPAFGARRLYGLYDPGPGIADRHIAPLMNANNLAGYITMALCLSLTALLAPEPFVPRPIAGALTLLLAAAQVWIGSRGGVITSVLGALVVGVIARVTHRGRKRHEAIATLALVSGLAMTAGAILIVLAGSEQASTELLDTNLSKLKMFTMTMRGVDSMPFLGCGRGAFESVFPAFRSDPGFLTYTHPENVIAQWSFEWGFPVGIGGLALVAFALRPDIMLARSAVAGGAWAGIVALGVQNLGDLGTEIPGLMLTAVVCAAMVVAGSRGNDPTWRVERWGRFPRSVSLVAGAAAVVALFVVSRTLGVELHDDQKAMQRAVERRATVAEMHAIARAAMLRHPAEPYLPLATALRAVWEKDDNPMPWLGATLERASIYEPAHMVLARLLAPRSKSQARLEYRLAMEQGPQFVPDLMAEAPRVVGGYFDAKELVPDGNEGAAIQELLVQAIQDRLPATVARLDAERPASMQPGIVLRAAAAAVSDLEAGDEAPWCQGSARSACASDALAKSSQVAGIEPQRCNGYVLRARARVATGDSAGGVAELEKATDEVIDRVSCLEQLVELLRRTGDNARADATLNKLVSAGCTDLSDCGKNLLWVGQQYEGTGRYLTALTLYKRAFEQSRDDVLFAHIAALAAGAGLHAEAAQDYEQLARRHPDNVEFTRLATAQHDAAMRAKEKL